jgi:hypothetical protein
MLKNFFNYSYGLLSIGVIEFGNLINTFSNIFDLFICLLQIVIAYLTIKKLYNDVVNNKYKSVDKSEKELMKKRPFLFSVFEYLKRFKK